MTRRPMSLQTRLMTAVIGFVSLILVIVAVITSALLGQDARATARENVSTAMPCRWRQWASTVRRASTRRIDTVLGGPNPRCRGSCSPSSSPR